MPSNDKKQVISVKISEGALAILSSIASQADVSRHKLINDILEVTIEEFEFGRKIGFFQMIVLMKKFMRRNNMLADDKPEKAERAIPIHLSDDVLSRLDLLAKQADRTRHYLMKKFIEVGAEELDKLYNKKVPITAGLMMRHLKKRLDILCQQGEKAIEMYNSDLELN